MRDIWYWPACLAGGARPRSLSAGNGHGAGNGGHARGQHGVGSRNGYLPGAASLSGIQKFACWTLAAIVLGGIALSIIVPADYTVQFRETPNAVPTHQHLLGTDELGRDRLARVLYGTRISLLLAPAAAFLSTLMAALIGVVSGYFGSWCERLAVPDARRAGRVAAKPVATHLRGHHIPASGPAGMGSFRQSAVYRHSRLA